MVHSFLWPIASYANRQSNRPAGQERDRCPQEDIQVSSQYCHVARLLRGTFDVFTIALRNPQPSISHQTAHNLYLCFDLCTGGELFDSICAKGNYYEKSVFHPFVDSCLTPPPSITGMPQNSLGPSSALLHTFISVASSIVTSSRKTCCSGIPARTQTS